MDEEADGIDIMKEQLNVNMKENSDIIEQEKQGAIDEANLQYEKTLEGEDLRQHRFKEVGLDDETVNTNLLILLQQQLNNSTNDTMVPSIIRLIKEKQADSDNYNNDESLYNIIKKNRDLREKICNAPENDEQGLYILKGLGKLTSNKNDICL